MNPNPEPTNTSETPETDAAENKFVVDYEKQMECGWPSAASVTQGYDFARSLETRLTAANREIEQKDMQLVAVMTASLQNTESTIKDRIQKDHPYWSVAYNDTCRAVDREMKLREELTTLKQQMAGMVGALEKLACLGNGDKHGNSVGNCIAIDALTSNQSLLDDYRLVGLKSKAAEDAFAIIEPLPELNMSNYDHEQVRQLNSGMIDAFHILKSAINKGQIK